MTQNSEVIILFLFLLQNSQLDLRFAALFSRFMIIQKAAYFHFDEFGRWLCANWACMLMHLWLCMRILLWDNLTWNKSMTEPLVFFHQSQVPVESIAYLWSLCWNVSYYWMANSLVSLPRQGLSLGEYSSQGSIIKGRARL